MKNVKLSVTLALIAWAALGCGADESTQCQDDSQCPEGQRCVLQACEDRPSLDGFDINGGEIPTITCEGGVIPAPGQLRINEIHAAPSTADDTNCDGVAGSDDEFIEIVNNSDVLLDLNGVQVKYDGDLKLALVGCLAPGRGLVVYGGEGLQAMCEDYGESVVQIAPKTLSMSNSGKSVSLDAADGTPLESVVYPSISGNSSWTRLPDFTGEFMFHAQVPGADTTFSAGKCVSGAPLTLGCPPPQDTTIPTDCDDAVPAPEGALRINELHAAPKAGEPAHDANCDGNPSSTQDEFVEIVNTSTQKVSVAGVQILVNGTLKHTLNTCLAPGRGLVVYSGGAASCTDLGETQAFVSEKAFSLSNSGGAVALADASGTPFETQAYTSISDNTSRTRFPDFTGSALVSHSTKDILGVTTPHSAGKCVSGAPLAPDCAPPGVVAECGNDLCETGESTASCPEDCTASTDCTDAAAPAPGDLKVNELHAAPKAGDLAHDANCDGNPSSTQDEFVEIVNSSTQKVSLDGVQLQVGGATKSTLAGCLAPGRGLVVYSGGTAACANLGETKSAVSTTSLGLSNSGSVVSLLDAGGVSLDSQPYTSISDNTSRTLFPDFTGSTLVKHNPTDIPGVTTPHSAGFCVSGAPLAPDCPPPGGTIAECGNGTCETGEDPTSCPDDCSATGCGNSACDNGETYDTCPADCPPPVFCEAGAAPIPGDIVINEVHFAPLNGTDDVNCDGTADSIQDEFIEIVNTSSQLINLADVTLSYNGTSRHTFTAQQACLSPGQGLVFYNKVIVPLCSADQLGGSVAVSALTGFALTNSGGTVSLDLDGTNLAATTYTTNSSNASWTRSPDLTGDFTTHHNAPNSIGRFSVGTCLNGGRFPDCQGSAGSVCGNDNCEADETPTSCPDDCATGPVCGDGTCNGTEDSTSCPGDCPAAPFCGDGTCNGTEDSTSCLQDCPVAPFCGDGSCNGTEDSTSCVQDCPVAPFCGDGTCNGTEDSTSCVQDCPVAPFCGDGTCNGTEDSTSCVQDCPLAACSTGVAPGAGDLVINELHFAPLSTADDVNCDALTSADDEYVELVNTTAQTLNLDGVTISYAGAVKHTFTAEQACLAPGQALLVYNALASTVTTTCAPGAVSVGGSLTVKPSTRFQMSNSTANNVSIDLSTTNLDSQTYTTNSVNSSWTRSPDISGGFVRHNTVSPNRFSLGTCVNGNTFPNCQ